MRIFSVKKIFLIPILALSLDIGISSEIYMDKNILSSVREIPIEALLKYENITEIMQNKEDRVRIYLMIAVEIERRIEELDKKFYSQQKFYIDKIYKHEYDLNLPIHHLNMIPIDLKNNQFPENRDLNYYKNKNRTKKASLIYIQKNYAYQKALGDLEVYYQAIQELYNSNKLEDYKNSLKKYLNIIKKYPQIKIILK